MKKYFSFPVGCFLTNSLFFLAFLLGCSPQPPQIVTQNPSPMADSTRTHERIVARDLPGVSIQLPGVLSKPVDVYLSNSTDAANQIDLVIHLHGAAFVPSEAVFQTGKPFIAAAVNLGAGSSAYERPFSPQHVFPDLVAAILDTISALRQVQTTASHIYLTSFSAGYGAVRAILKTIRDSEGKHEDECWADDAALGAKVFASNDAKEGPRAFMEKRKPNFTGN